MYCTLFRQSLIEWTEILAKNYCEERVLDMKVWRRVSIKFDTSFATVSIWQLYEVAKQQHASNKKSDKRLQVPLARDRMCCALFEHCSLCCFFFIFIPFLRFRLSNFTHLVLWYVTYPYHDLIIATSCFLAPQGHRAPLIWHEHRVALGKFIDTCFLHLFTKFPNILLATNTQFGWKRRAWVQRI